MKRGLKSFALALVVACAAASPAFAQDGFKIGVVDMQKVMKDYNKREAKYSALEAEVKALQAPIDAMSAQITKMKEDYEEKAKPENNAVPSEMLELETKIRRQHGEYEAALRQNQLKLDEMEAEVLKEILNDVNTTLRSIGEQENYHLILNARGGAAGSVVYHSATIDITTKVLARLNGNG